MQGAITPREVVHEPPDVQPTGTGLAQEAPAEELYGCVGVFGEEVDDLGDASAALYGCFLRVVGVPPGRDTCRDSTRTCGGVFVLRIQLFELELRNQVLTSGVVITG